MAQAPDPNSSDTATTTTVDDTTTTTTVDDTTTTTTVDDTRATTTEFQEETNEAEDDLQKITDSGRDNEVKDPANHGLLGEDTPEDTVENRDAAIEGGKSDAFKNHQASLDTDQA